LSGPEPLDPDLRPGIGRCWPEAQEVERLTKELRSIWVALGDAVAKLGECRASAQAANAAMEAGMTQALVTRLGDVIDQFDEDLQALTDCPACKQPDETKAE
jgi:molecular chaperone GrpE (heat shock protein)